MACTRNVSKIPGLQILDADLRLIRVPYEGKAILLLALGFRVEAWNPESEVSAAGLVAITSSCAVVYPWASVIIGLCSGLLFPIASFWVNHVLMVDDPVDSIAVHLMCGIWGGLAPGNLLRTQQENKHENCVNVSWEVTI